VLEYYKLKGCDGYLVKAVATMVGPHLAQYIGQAELCAALHRLATAGVETKAICDCDPQCREELEKLPSFCNI